MTDRQKPKIRLLLAAPRGFCAGVVRAIDIVEEALATYGQPVYVRHEIVHNKFVVDNLKRKGAIFVEELDEVPDGDHPVIFSAHGVPKTVPADARLRNLFYLDATCPLVSKVHMEASRHHKDGHQILLIGHEGHPEVVGTMGQLPKGAVTLIETVEDVASFQPQEGRGLAFITQTTLSVDDTKSIIDALQTRFPDINSPHKEDICYATTNRQASVKEIAHQCDMLLVVGAPNSSNSQRLVEVARTSGCENSILVQRASEIDWEKVKSPDIVGITAGASAPEVLVSEVIGAFQDRFEVTIDYVETAKESVTFKLPRQLRLDMKEKAATA
ncbi:4-hydroxy-3-methylbut-2-enyl diphosphate reductase [hydrothermal vent metagenome]|uniref:4-hydroxy-3-methylbut-2-enyl diphosphate reductase n=1 Tax=hydrothermal vent metagenome TaxID=652676 RepID=A0A3B0R197_9ZZZZ